MSVTARECLGQRCPVVGECFSEATRVRAREVDVVVTNHAMLAIDATENRKTLPQHDVVVVDEGHDLLDRVTAALSREVTAASVHAAASAARRAGCGADDIADLDRAAEQLETALGTTVVGRLADGAPPAVQDALLLLATAARGRCGHCPRTPTRAGRRRLARPCSTIPTSPNGSVASRPRPGSTRTTTTSSRRWPRPRPGST